MSKIITWEYEAEMFRVRLEPSESLVANPAYTAFAKFMTEEYNNDPGWEVSYSPLEMIFRFTDKNGNATYYKIFAVKGASAGTINHWHDVDEETRQWSMHDISIKNCFVYFTSITDIDYMIEKLDRL